MVFDHVWKSILHGSVRDYIDDRFMCNLGDECAEKVLVRADAYHMYVITLRLLLRLSRSLR